MEMKAKNVKQMAIAALVACAGILVSNAAVVASGEKEFALLPPVTLTGLSATAITYGQALAASTVSGTATTTDFGEVAGTFAWDAPATVPQMSDSQATAYAVTPVLTASKTSAKYGDSGWDTLPTLTVTGDSKTLASGTDYTATWSPSSVTGPGTYTVTVTLQGSYSGSQTATYTVDRRAVTLTSGTKQFFYDGQAHSNSTLKVSGDGFAAGEGVRGNSFATITEIGSTPNAFGYEFTGAGKAENYVVSCVQGTLTVIQYVEPSVKITSVRLADERDGTVEYTYKVDGTFGDKEYDVLIKVSVANGTKSTVVTHESVAVGSVPTNLNVKTLFGKAYPNVTLFAELKPGGGVQLWKDGPIFSECNIGAESPEEFGYYFWWGDTIGYVRNGNSWDAVDGSVTGYWFSSGYCPTYSHDNVWLKSNGWIDEDENLVAAHDAAKAYLDEHWRMPTKAELQALVDNCDSEFTELNGVIGRRFTGRDDCASKSIFLPITGYGNGSALSNPGTDGIYWSSTPNSDKSIAAWYLVVSPSNSSMSNSHRSNGLQVRPVRDAAK